MAMAHILVIPFPGQGHILPLLQLSKAIAARGFAVSFANISSIDEKMKHNSHERIRFESIPCKLFNSSNGLDGQWLQNTLQFFQVLEALGPSVVELVQRLNTQVSPVVAIISDYFLPWTQDVADKFDIPRITFSCFSAACVAIELAVPELISRGQLPTRGCDDEEEMVEWIPGVPSLRPSEIPIYLREVNWKDIPVLERSRLLRESNSKVLINTFEELEPSVLAALEKQLGYKCVPIGPALLYPKDGNCLSTKEDADCMKWLDTCEYGSVVYVSFGSVGILPTNQFKELATTLLWRVPFLWVIRTEQEEAILKEDAAWYQDFVSKCEKQGGGYILKWASQREVLGHPSVAAFITHCGWNSLLESVCNGVPMLAWPLNTDQNINTKLVVEQGIGRAAFTDNIWKAEDIWKCLEQVLKDHDMRKRVADLKEAAMNAVTVGTSVKSLEALVKSLTG